MHDTSIFDTTTKFILVLSGGSAFVLIHDTITKSEFQYESYHCELIPLATSHNRSKLSFQNFCYHLNGNDSSFHTLFLGFTALKLQNNLIPE